MERLPPRGEPVHHKRQQQVSVAILGVGRTVVRGFSPEAESSKPANGPMACVRRFVVFANVPSHCGPEVCKQLRSSICWFASSATSRVFKLPFPDLGAAAGLRSTASSRSQHGAQGARRMARPEAPRKRPRVRATSRIDVQRTDQLTSTPPAPVRTPMPKGPGARAPADRLDPPG